MPKQFEGTLTIKLPTIPVNKLAENCHKYARLCGIKKFHEWIEVYERGWAPEDILGLPRVIHPLTEEGIMSQKYESLEVHHELGMASGINSKAEWIEVFNLGMMPEGIVKRPDLIFQKPKGDNA